tara:strand:- start:96 stop:467 length:372 start_codon:yes stop_codon:yes gene_type:complete
MKWYLKVVRDNYANFSGRARRQEYWMFVLFNMIFAFLIAFVGGLLGVMFNAPELGMALYGIYLLAIIIPSIAVLVRRLHDIGKSGAWFFISFVPFIGGIWLLILMCTEGEIIENQYGVDPKAE